MEQESVLEDTARRRLRMLRLARGWTLDELSRRSHIGASTISRLETGSRRLALDQLVILARALESSIDELLVDEDNEEVIVRPIRSKVAGITTWLLTPRDDPSGRVVAKMRLPAADRHPEPRVHPGRDWFYVLKGAVRVRLGSREVIVKAGQAASFQTTTPHSLIGHGGTAEILSVLDHHGERAHLRPSAP